MLLKVVRENETSYYLTNRVDKITLSPVFGDDDEIDIALWLNGSQEIIKVAESYREGEDFIKRLFKAVSEHDEDDVVDVDRI